MEVELIVTEVIVINAIICLLTIHNRQVMLFKLSRSYSEKQVKESSAVLQGRSYYEAKQIQRR